MYGLCVSGVVRGMWYELCSVSSVAQGAWYEWCGVSGVI